MKRLVALALALLLVLTAVTALAEVTVSIDVMDADKEGKDVRSEIVKEKFDLTFNYIPVDWGSWNEKINTWINTDDSPDLIWWDLKGSTAQQYQAWAKDGAFRGITREMLEPYPNLLNVYDTAASIESLKVDGVLYAWPSLRSNHPDAQSCYTSHFSYRRDWAKAVGLYKENDQYTWEEWKELIRAVLAKDPGGNGTANAGLVLPTWGFPHAAVLFLNSPEAEGNETCSYIVRDGKYVWPPALPEYSKGVKETYDMYQEGLIYRDNVSFKGSESDEMMKAGLAFAAYNITGALNDWTTTMLRDGVIKEREDLGIAIVSGMDGNWYMTQTEDYWTVTALSHKITDEQIKAVFSFWDYLFTVDGMNMRSFGKEGVDFNKTGDKYGEIELLWPFDEKTQAYVSPFPSDQYAFNEATPACNGYWRDMTPKAVQYQYDELDRLWSTFGSSKNAVLKKFDYKVSFASFPNKDKYGSFGAEVKEKLISLITQPNIDIEAEWAKYVEEMMPRVQPVLDELNQNLL